MNELHKDGHYTYFHYHYGETTSFQQDVENDVCEEMTISYTLNFRTGESVMFGLIDDTDEVLFHIRQKSF